MRRGGKMMRAQIMFEGKTTGRSEGRAMRDGSHDLTEKVDLY